jgi:hypothetical protein
MICLMRAGRKGVECVLRRETAVIQKSMDEALKER